ncbi:hypothetical protein NL676_030173 [Syzygium grande]|nr:hypothetical protein NL676_030173 [Syzygium grande]
MAVRPSQQPPPPSRLVGSAALGAAHRRRGHSPHRFSLSPVFPPIKIPPALIQFNPSRGGTVDHLASRHRRRTLPFSRSLPPSAAV